MRHQALHLANGLEAIYALNPFFLVNHMAILSAGAALGTRDMDLKLKTLQGNGYFKGNCMCSERFKER